MEKLTTELEENLAGTGTRAFLQDGKRKRQAAGTKKKKPKRLKLDPLVGWGEGEVREEELEIQDWLTGQRRLIPPLIPWNITVLG